MEKSSVWHLLNYHRADAPAHRRLLGGLFNSDSRESLLVCQAIAILDDLATPELINQVVDEDGHIVDRVIGRLRDSGLLSGFRFPDPGLRRSVLDRISPDVKSWLHHRIADVLHRQGAAPSIVAQFLVEAGYARFPGAVAVLRAAADTALLHNETGSAVKFLELAYRATTHVDDRTAMAAMLVSVEWRANPSVTTRNFARLWAAARNERLAPTYLVALVIHLLWQGRDSDAHQVLLTLSTQTHDPDRTIEFLWSWLEFTHPQAIPSNASERFTVDRTDPATSPYEYAVDVLHGMMSGADHKSSIFAAQLILNHHRLGAATIDALVVAVEGLIHFGNLNDAAAWCDTLLAEAVARRAPTWQALFAALRAEISLRQGDMPHTVQYGLDALNLVSAKGLGTRIGRPLACLIRGLTATMQYDEARRQLDRPVPDAMFRSRYGLLYLHARGHYHLAVGDPDRALPDFERCGALMRDWGLDLPQLVPWRNDLAETYLAMGRPEAAGDYMNEHLRHLERTAKLHRTRGVSLRLLALTTTGENRVRLLGSAAAIARDNDDKYELARALGELGVAYDTLGQPRRAQALRRTATRLIKETTAGGSRVSEPVAVAIEDDVRGGAEQLSTAERRVAELAAAGMRNKEVAVELGITMSTVEQHLTHVYRKLRVKRRTELRFLVQPSPADGGGE
ncbi:LuxR C-terminal-related transcriptional regulator [Nocardia salmonicida]|uniref:LuxR C-terminal-related transcriptional regulator n=1 Tax=Nocardia salmonicida TaxID=53431 RepID=UPI002E2E6033|nr:LuxR C-terminal-related transcriptional regulator [Nocardia salmonicida]